MINTEKAFDLLPIVVDLYDKLDIDGYRKKVAEKNKGKKNLNTQDLGVDVVKYVLINSGKVKEEVFGVVAIMEEKTIEEVKAQSFTKTITVITELFKDKETTDFLTSAMK